MTRIYIDGFRVDVAGDKPVAHTLQAAAVGDISARKASFTNRFKLPMTGRNVRIMQYLGAAGNQSTRPYLEADVTITEGPVEVVTAGKAYISKTITPKREYEMFVVHGANKLMEAIAERRLSDLMDSLDPISTANATNFEIAEVTSSWANTDGQIYALANFGTNVTGATYTAEEGTAFFFVRTIFNAVFAYAGLTYESRYITNYGHELFDKLVIGMTRQPALMAFSDPVLYLSQIPDMAVTDFVKGVFNLFGFIIQPEGVSGTHFRIERIQDVLEGFLRSDDWTDKLAGEDDESYPADGNFGRRSLFQWKYDDNDLSQGYSDGEAELDFAQLQERKVTVELPFTMTRSRADVFTPLGFPINYVPWRFDDESENDDENDHCYLGYVEYFELASNMSLHCRDGNTTITAGNMVPVFMTRPGLDFDESLIDNHYSRIIAVNERPQVKKVRLHLSVLDIARLDFMRLKYFRQYADHFWLQKIDGWQAGKLCKAELVSCRNPTAGALPPEVTTSCLDVGGKFDFSFIGDVIEPGGDWVPSTAGTLTYTTDPLVITCDQSWSISQDDNTIYDNGFYLVRLRFRRITKDPGILSTYIRVKVNGTVVLTTDISEQAGNQNVYEIFEFTNQATNTVEVEVVYSLSPSGDAVYRLDELSICRAD